MKSDNIYEQYARFLKTIESDKSAFNNFKNDSSFREILEHIGVDLANEYISLAKNEFSVSLKDYVDIATLNDSVGTPGVHDFEGYSISPSNLRYLYHAFLIKSKCDTWFTDKKIKIVEIGGGYGGLCLFIKKIFKEYDIEYTIVDLPEPGVLQKKYLASVGLPEVRVTSCFDIDNLQEESFDLVISNYCISEISVENKNEYFEKIVKNSKKKFFVWNYLTIESNSFIWKNLKVKKVLALLGIYPSILGVSKKEYVFEKERPQTGGINQFIYSK